MFQRIPFVPAAAGATVDFCVRHPIFAYDPALLRRLLLTATSSPAGVLQYASAAADFPATAGPLAFVAAVIDVPWNGVGAATLELLGGVAPLPPALLRDHLLPDAIAFARGVRSRALQIGLPEASVATAAPALAAHGFAHFHDSCHMRRAADVPAPQSPHAAAPPLPAGFRWAPLDHDLAAPTHALLREAFRASGSMHLAPLDSFRRFTLGPEAPKPGWRVLLDGPVVAGAINLVVHADGAGDAAPSPPFRGELRTLARAPAYRGRGLGPLLLAEALRVLLAAGAGPIELDADVENDQALRLYRSAGFEVYGRYPWYRLDLAPAAPAPVLG